MLFRSQKVLPLYKLFLLFAIQVHILLGFTFSGETLNIFFQRKSATLKISWKRFCEMFISRSEPHAKQPAYREEF